MSGHLDYFQFLVISNRATMDDGHVSFGEHVLVFLLGTHPGVEVLALWVGVYAASLETPKQFPKWLYQFVPRPPPKVNEMSWMVVYFLPTVMS